MAILWLYVERATSHGISNNEPAAASIVTRRFLMRDQNSEAVTEDVYDAIGTKPAASHNPPYQLGIRVGQPMQYGDANGVPEKYDEWFKGCAQTISTDISNRPNPIVTSISVTPSAGSSYAWEVEVRAEVFWPLLREWGAEWDESPCYAGQYRRIASTTGVRQMKLYRVKDVGSQAPSDPTTAPTGFQWTGWIPTGTVDGQTIYGQPDNDWLTRDNTVTPAIGGNADAADWIGLDAGGSTVSMPVPQRTWTLSIVTSNWFENTLSGKQTFGLNMYKADQYVNARSFNEMFGAPRGTVKFDGVNISPMNKYWSRLDFRWTFDALAFMEQMAAKNSNGSAYVEPTPAGVTDPVLHAYARWYQPFPFLMNQTAASGTATNHYGPLEIIPDQLERLDVAGYVNAVGTLPA